MFTQKATEVLRELIDVNFEIETNSSLSVSEKVELMYEYSRLKKSLIQEIGQEEFDRFMENGRKMFAAA